MSEQPRKKPRSRLKKINISARDQWKKILKDVEKKEIPITLLQSLDVNLIDGTVVNINIKDLLDEGNDPQVIEEMLNVKLKALEQIVLDVDFFVSIEDVVKIIQPMTDDILKDL